MPTAAGGGNDAMARTIAQKLGPLLGQTIIIDNRAGANGSIASEFVARATPDGHTLMLGYIATHSMNPALQKLRYDPVTDFEPVGLVGYSPTLMVANANVPVKDVRDLVAQLKAKPDKYTYASAGNGTAPHFAAELFKLNAGTVMLGVPYKGSAPAVSDTIGGQTQFMFPSLFTAYPHVKSGKLRALAVAGPKRVASLPEVPTLKEVGVDGVDVTQWYAHLRARQDAQAHRRQAQQGTQRGAGRQGDHQAHRGPRCRRRKQHARAAGRPGQERARQVERRGAEGPPDGRLSRRPTIFLPDHITHRDTMKTTSMHTPAPASALATALVALLGLSNLAQAQSSSSVTVFGIADSALRHVSNEGRGSINSLVSGSNSTSRLGFRGTEDLGSGLSASFHLEHGILLDTGAQASATQFWDRRATSAWPASRWVNCGWGATSCPAT